MTERASSDYQRRDVAKMVKSKTDWDPALLAYAKAVALMKDPKKKNQKTDPTSWTFQANTHGVPGGVPSNAPEEWGQCPHGSPLFLPWHRAYVWYFERIVRKVINEELKISGQQNWALPYWNYAHVQSGDKPPEYVGSKAWRQLPLAFRQEKLPDGVTDNPLRYPHRSIGDGAIPYLNVNPYAAMSESSFDGFSPSLESTPHNKVHTRVGNGQGMGSVPHAALDPVFWLHHANIDRLWYAWLRTHSNPAGRTWPKTRPGSTKRYCFRDEKGTQIVLGDKPLFDAPAFDYCYESLSDGTGTAPTKQVREVVSTVSVPAGDPLVARGGQTPLGAVPVRIEPTPVPDAGDALAPTLTADAGGAGQVVLTVRGVRAEKAPGVTYGVYLGAREDHDEDLDPYGPHFVGDLDFFGASGADAHHQHDGNAGDGRTFTFDITDTLRTLRQTGLWSGEGVPPVSVAPIPNESAPGSDRAQPPLPVADAAPQFAELTISTN
ncbi:tyrosinase family protein [Streptomyces yunnanensis]|uniref:Tyrosinase n=1 Tax=Streptomyces yunnanensis TaxID=156453 RepID=A0A9X8N4J4_9ACTN|nr:tyrosinase family protein [Streptomyces yunnanensis]SHM94150.1 tyrosinase [Streptomyces yunnanensis]